MNHSVGSLYCVNVHDDNPIRRGKHLRLSNRPLKSVGAKANREHSLPQLAHQTKQSRSNRGAVVLAPSFTHIDISCRHDDWDAVGCY